jgi:predicted pyridoxine 5'-phosphate oxidase superfamily flavin-nucleotide-binding protein
MTTITSPSPAIPFERFPWHSGEREAQALAGASARMAEIGPRVIRAAMPQQHRTFFGQLPFMVVAADDEDGRVQATVLQGSEGFVRSPDERRLEIGALPWAGDPLAAGLAVGSSVGLLGIELPTRRRNRANGVVAARGDAGFAVAVVQSFGNCPQYIQRREQVESVSSTVAPTALDPGVRAPHPALARSSPAPTALQPAPSASPALESGAALPAPARTLLRSADTFFIGSRSGRQIAGQPDDSRHDISHRGGPPGFLCLSKDGATLTWPDYRGNFFFNTLGNLLRDPRAALVVADFASGDLLHITGRCRIEWDGTAIGSHPGAERLVRMAIDWVRWRPAAWRSRWRLVDYSSALPLPSVNRRPCLRSGRCTVSRR